MDRTFLVSGTRSLYLQVSDKYKNTWPQAGLNEQRGSSQERKNKNSVPRTTDGKVACDLGNQRTGRFTI